MPTDILTDTTRARTTLRAARASAVAAILSSMLLGAGAARADEGFAPAAPGIWTTQRPANATDGERFGSRAVLRPSQDAFMGFAVPTVIQEVLVRSGEPVKKGDLIVRGDDVEEEALLRIHRERLRRPLAVEEAKAQMDLAQVEYERILELEKKSASGTQEVERARLNAVVAKLRHELALSERTQEEIQLDWRRARVEKYRVVAPFDGIVDTVVPDVGQIVNENEKIVRVVDVDPLWIDVPAPMNAAATLSLAKGDAAWVLCPAPGGATVYEARVIEVAPTADAASSSRRVRVEVANPDGPHRLLAGQNAWVTFERPRGLPAATARGAEANR
ncbi:MAG TPA: efflux RND transporter periplasmic adaptor subunit [Phycisphaerales bacterium]|nr:efflux RND transporter periplasmic adaptor subunit [Phycisphaerales bacterium]